MNKNNAIKLVNNLKNSYPDAKCSLDFNKPHELVFAVMLSAQCTDERVNKTTPELFKKCPTLNDFINIDIGELEKIIHPCGFYKNKAKNIKLCALQLKEKFNSNVPQTMNELLSLAGIGRKSANVILLEVFGIASGIAIDTHAKRISTKLGLTNKNDPEKIEKDLLKIFPQNTLKDINHLFMWHGRNICTAKNPLCESCSINLFCNYYKNKHI